MKTLFSIVLIASLLFETLAAVTLLSGPEGIAAAGKGGMWSMHYGFAAIAIASASLWVWPYRSNMKAVTAILGVLMIFHTSLFISLLLTGDQQAGMVIHACLSVLCIGLFTQRAKWCVA